MGLLDQITSGLKGALSGTPQGGILEGIHGLLTSADTGGLEGLVQKFKDKGLGEVIASWIGTGENQPITQEKIQQVLGNNTIQQLAAKAGVSTDEIAKKLTVMLPEVIDKLTPNGKLPEAGKIAEGLNMLKDQFLKKG
ncbi:MAG TPA: YidB family protein [Nitrospirota bacterium]